LKGAALFIFVGCATSFKFNLADSTHHFKKEKNSKLKKMTTRAHQCFLNNLDRMVDQALDTAMKLKDLSNYWGIAHELRELIKANFILFPDFNAVYVSIWMLL
jgi:hypothetical protein